MLQKLSIIRVFQRLKEYRFLFEELVKRDFKQKYKRTALGMAWSILSPLLQLLVMSLIFTQFFGRNTPHYTIYIFCGTLVFNFFNDATHGGMGAIMGNAGIFTKINVPKYLFLLSRNVQSLINFGLIMIVFFAFVAFDGIPFTLDFFYLIYPIVCLVVFNIGVGLILSALFVFFRDTQYLYDIFTQLLMYMSAIFYQVDRYSPSAQRLFLLNPIYCYIHYFRVIVINGTGRPSNEYHLLCALYALVVLAIGAFMYKKYNAKFLYYV